MTTICTHAVPTDLDERFGLHGASVIVDDVYEDDERAVTTSDISVDDSRLSISRQELHWMYPLNQDFTRPSARPLLCI